ncbi:LETM1 domain-containing protein 1-like [Planococcus citri]|uniref:LETM1 domain-containing protein 1-like n=1 Tax=Planococcus citri TaxID=170843 RepID=UPI0031F7960F
MLVRSLLQQNTTKICCNTLYPQIRYGSNYSKKASTEVVKKASTEVVKIYDTALEKIRERFPRISAVYSLVYGGLRGIMNDVKESFRIVGKASANNGSAQCLSLEELEFFHNFKLSSRKLFPIGALAVLPFGNGLIIPLVYFLPRKTVTHHFWTEHQRATFPFEDHKDRLKHRTLVLNYLKECSSGRIADDVLKDWRKLTAMLDQGARPEVSDVAKVSSLFARSGPFYLQTLPKLHLMHLGSTYGITAILSPTRKIIRFAQLGVLMDRKIVERGGPKALPAELRSKICYMRGVDSMNMSQEEQIAFLQKWIQLNAKIDISNYSLLLHTPILLGYNTAHNVLKKR